VSEIGSQGFWFTLIVFSLKLAVYTMLASETFDAMKTGPKVSAVVLMLQLIMIPVSVGEWQFSLVSLLYINFVYCSLLYTK
jgi:hypothetical protein